MSASTFPALALAAAILDVTVGYPVALYNAIGHPVTWMGAWLGWLETRLNVSSLGFATRRAAGLLALVAYLAPVALVTIVLAYWLPVGVVGFVVLALLAAPLPAQQSLDQHVRAV